ncbi:MAG: iron-containing alcohol dehydrogenase [Peptoniphilaceae bacterium]|nr:iron-containing alcohol dehydrogenase [Peptoniphilaceae bacterium]
MKKLKNGTEIVFGAKALSVLQKFENKKVLIMTDSFISNSVLMNTLLRNIKSSNKVIIYDKVNPDPTLDLVGEALTIFIKENVDVLIGFGGGSSIDSSKGVIYFGNEVLKKDIYFVAVPTTSGTGSEVTSVAVIKDNDTHIKHLLQSDNMLPNLAILDSALLKELPRKIIANTGIDVLTHALEAYVGKNRSSFSDALSEKAGELVVKYLYRSFLKNRDVEAKEEMHLASMMAGMSFEEAGLGINHAIAHQIGALFYLPHGLCNGLILNEVIDYNAKDKKIKSRYANFARKIGISNAKTDDESLNSLKQFINTLQRIMNMPKNLSECNVEREKVLREMETLTTNALKDNCMKTAPKSITKGEIKEIIEKIY